MNLRIIRLEFAFQANDEDAHNIIDDFVDKAESMENHLETRVACFDIARIVIEP